MQFPNENIADGLDAELTRGTVSTGLWIDNVLKTTVAFASLVAFPWIRYGTNLNPMCLT